MGLPVDQEAAAAADPFPAVVVKTHRPLACTDQLLVELVKGLGLAVTDGYVARAFAAYDVCKCFGGEEASRPYLAGLMSSGLFDEGIAALEAFERSGASGLQDTDVTALSMALGVVRYGCRGPEGERKVRAAASALTYAINNNLDMLPSVGATSSSSAALIACIVFGRDESTETFRFTQEHTDVMLTGWIHMMKGVGHRARQEPNSDTRWPASPASAHLRLRLPYSNPVIGNNSSDSSSSPAPATT